MKIILQQGPRIFCMMITIKQNLATRAQLMLDTWLHKCDDYKFVLMLNTSQTSQAIDDGHYLQPAGLVDDSFKKLTDKVYRMFMHAYLKYPNFDWYLKADDDTYIIMENLRWFLRQKNASEPVSFG